MIKNFDSNVGRSKKIKPNFKGSYLVKQKLRNSRYVISDVEEF